MENINQTKIQIKISIPIPNILNYSINVAMLKYQFALFFKKICDCFATLKNFLYLFLLFLCSSN